MPAPAMDPSYFDIGTGEAYPRSDGPRVAAWVIDQIASSAETFPDWVVEETGAEIWVSVTRGEGSAMIAFEVDSIVGEIALRVDASGWIEVSCQGLRGWIDHPYEELDIWPDGTAARAPDAPGRIGKRMNWISLDAKSWPVLRPLANAHGWVNLRARN